MSWNISININGISLENADWNYTHNCNQMMRDAGYDWVYHLDGQRLDETLPKFEAMLKNLKAEPKKYRAMNPDNSWGDYDSLVKLWEEEIIPRAKEILTKVTDAQWSEWS